MQMTQGAENNAEILVMSEEGREFGYVLIDIKSSVVRMLKIEIFGCNDLSNMDSHSRMCADSMMRAAASYGATVGAYQIESKIDALEDYFCSVGFVFSGGRWLNSLLNIVKICKK